MRSICFIFAIIIYHFQPGVTLNCLLRAQLIAGRSAEATKMQKYLFFLRYMRGRNNLLILYPLYLLFILYIKLYPFKRPHKHLFVFNNSLRALRTHKEKLI